MPGGTAQLASTIRQSCADVLFTSAAKTGSREISTALRSRTRPSLILEDDYGCARRNERKKEMTTCYYCAARFAADPASEAAWREMHIRRFHQSTRATTQGDMPGFVPAAHHRRANAGRTHRHAA